MSIAYALAARPPLGHGLCNNYELGDGFKLSKVRGQPTLSSYFPRRINILATY